MNFSYIASKSLLNLEILKFLIVRPGVQLFNIFKLILAPFFKFLVPLAKATTRTGCSNSLCSPPMQCRMVETQCWLLCRLLCLFLMLHCMRFSCRMAISLPSLGLAEGVTSPASVACAARPHAANTEEVGVAVQGT